jgi:hypothetical protein
VRTGASENWSPDIETVEKESHDDWEGKMEVNREPLVKTKPLSSLTYTPMNGAPMPH